MGTKKIKMLSAICICEQSKIFMRKQVENTSRRKVHRRTWHQQQTSIRCGKAGTSSVRLYRRLQAEKTLPETLINHAHEWCYVYPALSHVTGSMMGLSLPNSLVSYSSHTAPPAFPGLRPQNSQIPSAQQHARYRAAVIAALQHQSCLPSVQSSHCILLPPTPPARHRWILLPSRFQQPAVRVGVKDIELFLSHPSGTTALWPAGYTQPCGAHRPCDRHWCAGTVAGGPALRAAGDTSWHQEAATRDQPAQGCAKLWGCWPGQCQDPHTADP